VGIRNLVILTLSVLILVLPSTLSQPAIGPSTVGTTNVSYALGNTEGYNHGGFYAVGRYWAWYTDGTNELLTSSTDGLTWSTPLIIRPGTGGAQFAGTFDGTYFHYVSSHSHGQTVYRRGQPNSDGTITWSAPEQVVVTCGTTFPYSCDDATIAIDSRLSLGWIFDAT
jgi:hypothetical protein